MSIKDGAKRPLPIAGPDILILPSSPERASEVFEVGVLCQESLVPRLLIRLPMKVSFASAKEESEEEKRVQLILEEEIPVSWVEDFYNLNRPVQVVIMPNCPAGICMNLAQSLQEIFPRLQWQVFSGSLRRVEGLAHEPARRFFSCE